MFTVEYTVCRSSIYVVTANCFYIFVNYLDDYKKYFANFKQIEFAKCEDAVVVPVVDVASRQRIQRFYEQQVLLTSNINSEKITGQSSE